MQYDPQTQLYLMTWRDYDPTMARFIIPDTYEGEEEEPLSKNRYMYAEGDPVNYIDQSGHWVNFAINAAWAAYDGYSAYKSGRAKGLKGIKLTRKVAWAAGSSFVKIGKVGKVLKFKQVKKVVKVANNGGRLGKQARLRELANDDKVSSALRGEIKRDINEITRGKRKNIRVPKGHELAHRRGFEARKGFGYDHSDIQTIRNHRIQHKIDGYGRR